MVELVGRTPGAIVEIAAGDGALTLPLAGLGRPLLALELDPVRADRLRRRSPPGVRVECADLLTHDYPTHQHVVVGNVPFHLTTAVLRALLERPHWSDAVLLTQWEVARRRAGVGGGTLLTASWWPWFEFTLHRRVPASAFRPRPSVDAGLLSVHRRPRPGVHDRAGYQRLVRRVFTGRGHGLAEVLVRNGLGLDPPAVDRWLRGRGLRRDALPRDLDPGGWADLWRLVQRQRRGGRRPWRPRRQRRA